MLTSYDMPGNTLADHINQMENHNMVPLHVEFDPLSYYFVCGYYNCTHKSANKIDCYYSCADKYTWVKFESEKDIKEFYNDTELVVAFQLNRSSFVTDILSRDSKVSNMEHFQIYNPLFDNGLNTSAPITFDETFVYFDYDYSTDKSIVYYSTSVKYNDWNTLPCVRLDNRFYITRFLYKTYPDRDRVDGEDRQTDFGEYYDDLIDKMQTDRYSVSYEDGSTTYYGTILIEDLVNVVLK